MKKFVFVLLFFVSIDVFAFGQQNFKVSKEPWSGGVYISDGDIAHSNEDAYLAYYTSLFEDSNRSLIVNVVQRSFADNAFDIWDEEKRFEISYCISDEFGDKKGIVQRAFRTATHDWMQSANVRFRYRPSEDRDCHPGNLNVIFDVRPVRGAGYEARAFFPSTSRENSNVLIDETALLHSTRTFRGIILHELGHVLGFRHEHIHPSNEHPECAEGGQFESLTEHDKKSVMHYPQCGGENSFTSLQLTEFDRQGAAEVYPQL